MYQDRNFEKMLMPFHTLGADFVDLVHWQELKRHA